MADSETPEGPPLKLPYYPRYVDLWATSPKVRAMRTFSERGLYCELLDLQWQEGSIPAEPEACWDSLGVGSKREFTRAWPKVEPCFPMCADGRRRNGKLEEVRAKTVSTLAKRRRAGLTKRRAKSLEKIVPEEACAEHVLSDDPASPLRSEIGDWRGEGGGEVLPSSDLDSTPSPLKLSSPPGDVPSRPRRLVKRPEPEGFAEFYEAYPRRTHRLEAAKAYGRLTVAERAQALAAIPAWTDCHQWQSGKIEYPATFLNQGLFKEPPPSSNGTGTPTDPGEVLRKWNEKKKVEEELRQ